MRWGRRLEMVSALTSLELTWQQAWPPALTSPEQKCSHSGRRTHRTSPTRNSTGMHPRTHRCLQYHLHMSQARLQVGQVWGSGWDLALRDWAPAPGHRPPAGCTPHPGSYPPPTPSRRACTSRWHIPASAGRCTHHHGGCSGGGAKHRRHGYVFCRRASSLSCSCFFKCNTCICIILSFLIVEVLAD